MTPGRLQILARPLGRRVRQCAMPTAEVDVARRDAVRVFILVVSVEVLDRLVDSSRDDVDTPRTCS